MPTDKKYPNNLRKYRLKLSLSQKDVVSMLGVASAGRLSAWEQGSASPSIATILFLAEIYTVPVETLYGPLKRKLRYGVKKRRHKNNNKEVVKSCEPTIDQELNTLAELIVETFLQME